MERMGTRRSRPPGSTYTPCLTPTRRTSMPSLASPIDAGEPVFHAGARRTGAASGFPTVEQIAGRCLRRCAGAGACFSLSRDSHRARAVVPRAPSPRVKQARHAILARLRSVELALLQLD